MGGWGCASSPLRLLPSHRRPGSGQGCLAQDWSWGVSAGPGHAPSGSQLEPSLPGPLSGHSSSLDRAPYLPRVSRNQTWGQSPGSPSGEPSTSHSLYLGIAGTVVPLPAREGKEKWREKACNVQCSLQAAAQHGGKGYQHAPDLTFRVSRRALPHCFTHKQLYPSSAGWPQLQMHFEATRHPSCAIVE